jgi:hypothetical protein
VTLASARLLCRHKQMGPASISVDKKRGRPATGVGTMVGVRLQPRALEALDAWIADQPDSLSRAEAMRRIVAEKLGCGE